MAMAARIRFPAYCAVPLPDGVSDRAGALLEPLAVALHALRRGGAAPGETVVVLGFGAIGACTAEIAGAMGLTVLVSEPGGARRARARQMGHATIAPEGSPREVQANEQVIEAYLGRKAAAQAAAMLDKREAQEGAAL